MSLFILDLLHTMNEKIQRLYQILNNSVSDCNSTCISLSGGLDSSILASLMKSKEKNGISIICKEFPGADLSYCQMVAKKFQLPLVMKLISTEEVMTAIDETIKILKVFNDIEIRNSVVMYLSLQTAKNEGYKSIITGDGADELFAGYDFFQKMTEDELKENLPRIWNTLHFPAQKIGKSLKIIVESPFLNEHVVDFAKSVPIQYNIKLEKNQKFGKWLLRKTFENSIPQSITWRRKSAMQDGAGISQLVNIFDNIISDESFNDQIKLIKKTDDVSIRSKESLHYYLIYRKYYDIPKNLHTSNSVCKYCHYEVLNDAHFCKMCGAFPI